uniref:Uncharacterized protein n=1 Tax=Rhizophora mucronata TaxID=61149 RepID=A0A2P2IJE1_RHIMU
MLILNVQLNSASTVKTLMSFLEIAIEFSILYCLLNLCHFLFFFLFVDLLILPFHHLFFPDGKKPRIDMKYKITFLRGNCNGHSFYFSFHQLFLHAFYSSFLKEIEDS